MEKNPRLTPVNILKEKILDFYKSQNEIIEELVSPQSYRSLSHHPNASSFGKHFRHILDFLESFTKEYEKGTIDYTTRTRENRIEQDRDFALTRSEKILTELAHLDLQQKCLVCTKDLGVIESTTSGELAYLVDHGVHHSGILRMIMELNDIHPPQEFGYAQSTLTYLESV